MHLSNVLCAARVILYAYTSLRSKLRSGWYKQHALTATGPVGETGNAPGPPVSRGQSEVLRTLEVQSWTMYSSQQEIKRAREKLCTKEEERKNRNTDKQRKKEKRNIFLSLSLAIRITQIL
jgi:hypothetical protein